MQRKSPSCRSKRTGRPLTEYDSRSEAKADAKALKQRYHQDLRPYHCPECGLWHLSPADRQTPSSICPVCRGADGQPKAAYANQAAGQQRAAILRKEQGVTLTIYKCEYGFGWHLTKSKG